MYAYFGLDLSYLFFLFFPIPPVSCFLVALPHGRSRLPGAEHQDKLQQKWLGRKLPTAKGELNKNLFVAHTFRSDCRHWEVQTLVVDWLL